MLKVQFDGCVFYNLMSFNMFCAQSTSDGLYCVYGLSLIQVKYFKYSFIKAFQQGNTEYANKII